MDFDALIQDARARLDPISWEYYRAVAGGHPDRDHLAWQDIDVVPRVLQGLTTIDSSLVLGGIPLATPIMVAATASPRLAPPDGEIATARAAAAVGALMVY